MVPENLAGASEQAVNILKNWRDVGVRPMRLIISSGRPRRGLLVFDALLVPFSSFTVHSHRSEESPVVVEVPHAGLDIPEGFRSTVRSTAYAIAADADLFVEDLFADAPLEGATLLVAHVSRHVIDLNRDEQQIDDEVVEGGSTEGRVPYGLVWKIDGRGAPVHSRKLTRQELDARIAMIYRPYHEALHTAPARKMWRFGHAILLAAHSMPSVGRDGAARADVVPGSQGETTADGALLGVVEAHARAAALSVRHDDPFRGGFSTRHYGEPHKGVHAIQLELARRLYLDERSLTRTASFDRTRRWCRDLIPALARALPR